MTGKHFHHERGGHCIRITDNGRKNQSRVSRIFGILSEESVDDSLTMLVEQEKIRSFRKATQKEDQECRTDFVVILASGREIGIQVKSSGRGVAKFRREEEIRRVPRDYPVMAFVPRISAEEADEAARLIKELNRFESSLKKRG